MRKKKNRYLIAGLCALILCAGDKAEASETKKIEEGVAYLERLEEKDTTVIEAQIKEIKKKERQQAMENGELSVWDQFYDSVIMGDSRTVGLIEYELMDSSRVIAGPGDRIDSILEHLEEIVTMNPENLFLSYGLNDAMGFYAEPSDFIDKYSTILRQVKERLPDVHIYINSILPVQDFALYENEGFSEIGSYNEALREFCGKNGYGFIDNSQVVAEHWDLYEDDGIHLRKDFYEYWLMNMINGVEVE